MEASIVMDVRDMLLRGRMGRSLGCVWELNMPVSILPTPGCLDLSFLLSPSEHVTLGSNLSVGQFPKSALEA